MENKKLVNILLKDMGELEEMVAEMKNKGHFNTFEIEFLHTRAKGILQLLQMLNGIDSEQITEKKITTITEKDTISEEIPEKDLEIKSDGSFADEGAEHSEKERIRPENTAEKDDRDEKEETVQEEVKPEIKIKTETTEIGQQETINFESREVELEEEKVDESKKRLGDSFLKGKSVNDLITDQNKLEFKLSNLPVSSIQAAIGINDRFQYIRELFNGNSEIFSETVSSLDTMSNINDAVAYLQKNFKWKKNETSLKFVNLVKRRFAND